MNDGVDEIKWAPRVPKRKIRNLYESEASGLLDEDFLNDVGLSLYLRCESILTVGQAQRGEVLCPRCQNSGYRSAITRRSHRNEEMLKCPKCSWHTTWGAYFKTDRTRMDSRTRFREVMLARE